MEGGTHSFFSDIALGRLIAGALVAVGAAAAYGSSGFSIPILITWFAGIFVSAFSFTPLERRRPLSTVKVGMADGNVTLPSAGREAPVLTRFTRGSAKPLHRLDRIDWLIVLLLVLVFGCAYFAFIHDIPWQVNTDEITIMMFEKMHSGEVMPDLFGLSSYFSFAELPFIVFGWIGRALGGITLGHMREVHAASGLAIILLSYVLFRLLLSRSLALVATVILGINHSLLAISRMAMRDNTGLLVEVAAFVLLLRALASRSMRQAFFGGAIAGLAFYTYFPGRVTPFIWFGLLALLWLFRRGEYSFSYLFSIAMASAIGCILVALPIVIATMQKPDALTYAREQMLFYPEGQALEQQWMNAKSVREALWINAEYGLKTFNWPISDEGFIYPNTKHGFVDPLTGVLVWVGLIASVARIVLKRERGVGEFLAPLGFLILWLSFAFLFTKAPNYTRLLVILPFVAYLGATALADLARLGERLVKKIEHSLTAVVAEQNSPNIASVATVMADDALSPPFTPGRIPRIFWRRALRVVVGPAFRIIIPIGVLAIVVWNIQIFGDFVLVGFEKGNDVGGTARFVEARNRIPGYTFYLAADPFFPYYSWGSEYQWQSWFGFFASPDQKAVVIPPAALQVPPFPSPFGSTPPTPNLTPPFTLFLSQSLWQISEPALHARYQNLIATPITPDGRLVAIVVR